MGLICATLGMFIVDIFDFPPDKPQVPDQVGGGGLYVTVAARMFLQSEEVGMVIDRGSDWEPHWQKCLDAIGPCWRFRDDRTRLTTKARATYHGETRGFEYLVPKIRLNPRDLAANRLDRPAYLHFVCSPTRAVEVIAELDTLGWSGHTQLVYEPIPDCCVPGEMGALRQVLPRIHYFSPNHEEAGTFFGLKVEDETEQEKIQKIEELAQTFLDEGARNSVIIRSGKLGAYVKQRSGGSFTQNGLWVPAYYQNSNKVVDVTGAGNAFLGGLIAGLSLHNGDIAHACIYGSVASSYIIEQYGLPSPGKDGSWNNTDKPLDRVERMRHRLSM